jgi:TATA-binding protein-associated factor Taf7
MLAHGGVSHVNKWIRPYDPIDWVLDRASKSEIAQKISPKRKADIAIDHALETFRKDRGFNQTILEARKQLRYINEREYEAMLVQLNAIIADVQKAVDAIEALHTRQRYAQ